MISFSWHSLRNCRVRCRVGPPESSGEPEDTSVMTRRRAPSVKMTLNLQMNYTASITSYAKEMSKIMLRSPPQKERQKRSKRFFSFLPWIGASPPAMRSRGEAKEIVVSNVVFGRRQFPSMAIHGPEQQSTINYDVHVCERDSFGTGSWLRRKSSMHLMHERLTITEKGW